MLHGAGWLNTMVVKNSIMNPKTSFIMALTGFFRCVFDFLNIGSDYFCSNMAVEDAFVFKLSLSILVEVLNVQFVITLWTNSVSQCRCTGFDKILLDRQPLPISRPILFAI